MSDLYRVVFNRLDGSDVNQFANVRGRTGCRVMVRKYMQDLGGRWHPLGGITNGLQSAQLWINDDGEQLAVTITMVHDP